jgi:hypothetical protein
VDAQREHSRQQVEWWLDVDHAALDAPASEAVHVDAPPYNNRAILMPS